MTTHLADALAKAHAQAIAAASQDDPAGISTEEARAFAERDVAAILAALDPEERDDLSVGLLLREVERHIGDAHVAELARGWRLNGEMTWQAVLGRHMVNADSPAAALRQLLDRIGGRG